MKLCRFSITFLLAIAGAAMAQNVPFLSEETPIGPRDTISVRVLEDSSVNNERVVVNSDGQVVLNVVGKVQVAGLTVPEVESRLKALLEANYLAKATVSVQVVEFASKPISVLGAVVHPGSITVNGNTTLIQAITLAGGLAQGHGKDIFVLRTGRSGLSEQVAVDIDELMTGASPDLNLPLAPNDLINVPVDPPITVYIMGEVMRPGKSVFRSSQTPTLLQVIADSGGPTDRASSQVIIRRNESGKQATIKVNYRDILKGRKPDVVLKDNDTVWIGEALF